MKKLNVCVLDSFVQTGLYFLQCPKNCPPGQLPPRIIAPMKIAPWMIAPGQLPQR